MNCWTYRGLTYVNKYYLFVIIVSGYKIKPYERYKSTKHYIELASSLINEGSFCKILLKTV